MNAHGDDGFELAWEPRGEWFEARDLVGELCAELELIHVVDRFREPPAADHDILYTRLHGRNEDRFDYSYDYGEAELDDLADMLRNAAEPDRRV